MLVQLSSVQCKDLQGVCSQLESFYYSFDLLMWKQLVINLTISVSVKEIMSNKFYFEPGYQPLHSNLVNIAIFRFEYGNIQI